MTRSGATLALLLIAVPASAQPAAQERSDLVLRARAILKSHCSECHKPGGQSFDILDHAVLTGPHPVPFVDLKKGGRSQVVEFLEDGSMPPAGRPRPSQEDIGALKAWIAAGAPVYPKAFDDAMVAAAVEADWRTRKPAENQRYVSFANLIESNPSLAGLREQESKLRAALQSATSGKRAVELAPVDPAGTVYRLDVKKLGWIEPDQFVEIDPRGAPGNPSELLAVDLVSLEYPFAVIEPARFAKLLPKSRHAILRGDWLIEALAPGSPLAADLRAMAELADAKPDDPPPGVKVSFAKLNAPTANGTHPPLTAWYAEDRTSNLLAVQFGLKDRKPPYSVKSIDKLLLEATSSRTARSLVFNLMSDGTVRQRTAIESVLKQGEPFAFPGELKLSIIGAADEQRERFVLFTSDQELPKFTIVRSQHANDFEKHERFPIWRIAIDPASKFDPARVVRRTIEIRVTRK